MADTNQVLKPCPFCGMPAVMERYTGTKHTHYSVACSNTGCTVRPETHAYRDKQALIEKWNTRADAAPARWQPIDSAPRFQAVLVYLPVIGTSLVAMKDGSGSWHFDNGGTQSLAPTHWMPLPPGPSQPEVES